MLILTRKEEQTIQIGADVFIKIIEIRGERVRVGIEAPPGLTVDRGEIWSQRRRHRERRRRVLPDK